LTWAHLFPANAAYDCATGPDWFGLKLLTIARGSGQILSISSGQAHSTSSGQAHSMNSGQALSTSSGRAHPTTPTPALNSDLPVHVMWNDASPALERAAAGDGIVAINCRKFPVARLEAAGYKYIRHFAALPNLKNARWFVPLDSPAVASAGLSLYTPTRISAKIKRGLLRTAMHSRLPIWYRDHVWIAQREVPRIESTINPLFPSQDVRWALSSGAPEGARNRKASALVIATDGKMLAFVKMAQSDISRRILSREASVLEHLAKVPGVMNSVPQLLFSGEIEDLGVLAQKPLAGAPAPLGLTPAHRAFLTSLQSPLMVKAADTSMAAGLQSRLRALPTLRPDLAAICERVMAELRQFEVPMTIVHGDFAPWNLRIAGGKISAFDWEYGEVHALPLIDEIHYLLQCGWLLEEWTTPEALACLDKLAESRPLGLEPREVESISSAYLLDALARLFAEGYEDEEEVIAWHRRLLDCLDFRAAHGQMEVAVA
jgi:hypothetical protein